MHLFDRPVRISSGPDASCSPSSSPLSFPALTRAPMKSRSNAAGPAALRLRGAAVRAARRLPLLAALCAVGLVRSGAAARPDGDAPRGFLAQLASEMDSAPAIAPRLSIASGGRPGRPWPAPEEAAP